MNEYTASVVAEKNESELIRHRELLGRIIDICEAQQETINDLKEETKLLWKTSLSLSFVFLMISAFMFILGSGIL